jgi:HEAT repeat protein
LGIDNALIRTLFDTDGERPARPQRFQLRGKVPYVVSGEQFEAEASIIAGIPPRRASLGPYLQNKYDPLGQVAADDAVDRYAAVKSLPFLPEKKKEAMAAIEKRLHAEKEDRVLLEAAGAGAALGSEEAWARIGDFFVWGQERADLRMEAVFILTELGGDRSRDTLVKIATDAGSAEDEIRQAAVWGLGKTGLKRYVDLMPFLNDAERDVVLHAVAAFGSDTPSAVIDLLIAELTSGDKRRAPAASEALRMIGSDDALRQLIGAAEGKNISIDWILATLGRFPADKVRTALKDNPLLDRLGPLLLLSNTDNWLAEDTADIDMKFLFKQNL